MTAKGLDRPPIRAAQKQALFELQQKIIQAGSAPCIGSKLWISDDSADQEFAAGHCQRCPVISACRDYGLAYPREQGVYGGLTEFERQRRKS